ncbi:hypothetical protein [Spirosoma jeollabukense]
MPEYQSTRGEVIEKGVSLEAGISSLIGMLLDIDVETSLSLGSKNTSLSLNSKVNLLSDLKFVPKEVIWQFQTFAEIRNKFAHVQYVDSFEKCFEILADKKSKFIKTFGEKIGDDVDEEIKLSICFSFLCMSLGIWLQLILKKASFNKNQDLKKTFVVELLRHFFRMPEDQKDSMEEHLKWVDNLINDIEVDKDFIESIEYVRKLNFHTEVDNSQ